MEVPAHGLRLMRIAAFYGANASGKSNLITAMETARRLIACEQPSDARLPASFFRLDPASSSKPSRFQFDFIVDEIRYTYVIAFKPTTITAEALYRKLPNVNEEEMVYEREAPAEKGEHHIELGPMFDLWSEDDRRFVRFTARGTNARQSILLKFAISNVQGFAPIRNWLAESLKLISPEEQYQGLTSELHGNAAMREFVAHMLSTVGTGIQGLEIEKTLVPELRDRMISAKKLEVESVSGGEELTVDAESGHPAILVLQLLHHNRSGFKQLFSLQDESDGTQRLLHLLPVLFHRTKKSGLCTIIDEIDRSLHTLLNRHFVQEFLSLGSDSQTQLIFTTHDTNLLNGRLLPASAIWFVEKDADGASRIHSLAEYKPEQLEYLLEHLEEGYLQGRFGAIPFIAERDNLRWQPRGKETNQ
ncbi:MAG TPA: ATP-binding protein [Polyangium sp.]|nr:ATP-binding protein [Polyangium sp.]